jgi:hypothetical protein
LTRERINGSWLVQRGYCPAMAEANLEVDRVLLAVADLEDEIVIDAENQ